MEKLTKYTNIAHILKTNELVDKVNLIESEGGKIQKIKVNNKVLEVAPDKSVNIDLTGYAEDKDIFLYVGDSTQVPEDKMKENMVIIDPNEISSGSNIAIDSELSTESENSVQNKVITTKINQITSDINNINKKVPVPTPQDINKFLRGDGSWGTPQDTTYSEATEEEAGLFSAADKQKMNGIAVNANNYIHPNNHPANMITGLSKVATSGNYNDLINKPIYASQSEAEAGTDDSKMMTPLRTKQATTKYCLPLTGGIMTGAIVAGRSMEVIKGDTTKNIVVASGNTYEDSPCVILYPSNNGEDNLAGQFHIRATKNDSTIILVGKSTGQLIWNNKNIVRSVNGVSANDSGNVAISGAAAHNSIYRGKALGSSVTAEQWNAIKAGTFDDLYIGDYWTISGVDYVIAAFDYYLHTGDTECTKHHVTIVPRGTLYNHVMNDTNIVTGAYIGSKMYKSGLNQAKTTITNAFGSSHILTIRQLYTTTTNPDYGFGTAFAWQNDSIFLMNEVNVYGCYPFTEFYRTTQWGSDKYSIDNSQYPIFAFDKTMIHARQSYWLRNVADSTDFASVNGGGNCNDDGASNSLGVRPAFNIYQS